jgi:hypothetical protein
MTTDFEKEPRVSWIRSQMANDSSSASLYAVVDACQASALIELASRQYGQPKRMLFRGKAAALEEVESFAPFFIPIDVESDLLEYLITYFGTNFGVLFTSNAEPVKVFRHLRKIFVVEDDKGQEHFFRFYDPRVLRVYLPACTRDELRKFFGPIDAFCIEGQAPNKLVKFWVEATGLQILTV